MSLIWTPSEATPLCPDCGYEACRCVYPATPRAADTIAHIEQEVDRAFANSFYRPPERPAPSVNRSHAASGRSLPEAAQ